MTVAAKTAAVKAFITTPAFFDAMVAADTNQQRRRLANLKVSGVAAWSKCCLGGATACCPGCLGCEASGLGCSGLLYAL